MTHALTIGQLAKATGVASKTIRYYEQIGVLPPPSRSAAKYRQYDASSAPSTGSTAARGCAPPVQ